MLTVVKSFDGHLLILILRLLIRFTVTEQMYVNHWTMTLTNASYQPN